MTQKQSRALGAILSALPEDKREIYLDIAQCAVSMGYMPSLKGARKDYADFTNSRLKKTIMKINANPEFIGISMKFFAIPEYAGIFEKAIEDRLETWKRLGYEARCFGCGKCDGTQGYRVRLADGRRGFLCGFSLLPIPSFGRENAEEIKNALRLQNDYFVSEAGRK